MSWFCCVGDFEVLGEASGAEVPCSCSFMLDCSPISNGSVTLIDTYLLLQLCYVAVMTGDDACGRMV